MQVAAPTRATGPGGADPHGIGAVAPGLLHAGMQVRYYPVVVACGVRQEPFTTTVERAPWRDPGGQWLVRVFGVNAHLEFVAPVDPVGLDPVEPDGDAGTAAEPTPDAPGQEPPEVPPAAPAVARGPGVGGRVKRRT